MKKELLVFACLALCAAPVWAQGPYGLQTSLDFTNHSYTFDFLCESGEYHGGYGESDMFHPEQDGNVKLWMSNIVHENNSLAYHHAWLIKNGIAQDPHIWRGRECSHVGPISVTRRDDLQLRIDISCQNGPAGRVWVTAKCMDAAVPPPECLRPNIMPR